MRRKIVKFALPLVVLAGALSSHVANAQSCSTWASNIVAQYSSSSVPSLAARFTSNGNVAMA